LLDSVKQDFATLNESQKVTVLYSLMTMKYLSKDLLTQTIS